MAKVTRVYSRQTRDALEVLGGQIRRRRSGRRWSLDELASRVGASRQTVSALERGESTVAAGLYFEAAVLCGVPLFEMDAAALAREAGRTRDLIALLPSKTRADTGAVHDDF